MKIHSIKGMHDVGPPEIQVWQRIEKIASGIFETAGFSELRTPILEEEALFTQSLGNTTEIVEKEMYRFPDRKEKMLALRPEGTASIVRAYLQNYLGQNDQFHRFYYKGPMFRYERPQKGRYRQFYQIGAEAFGASDPYPDAELIHLADQIFKKLRLSHVALKINSLGCRNCRPRFREALLQFLRPIASKLCEDCNRRLERNPLRVLDCKNPSCVAATEGAPSSLDSLCEPCLTHFEKVQHYLRVFSVAYEVNARMVRGLDYYERTTFEFLSGELGAQNAVAGGGRYDGLVEQLGGPSLPGVGFAIGMERLASLVPPLEGLSSAKPTLFFACLGEESLSQMIPSISKFREAGFIVLTEDASRSLKSLLKTADRLQVDYTVLVGENELSRGVVLLKNMKSGEQKEIQKEALVAFFQ